MEKKKLIVLYGKPGVGKLTVAKELSLLTDFPFLHSHLVSDLVYSLFSRKDPEGSLLKQEIRVKMLDTWGKHGDTSIIITQLYKKGKNEKYFIEMSDTLKSYDFEVIYIHLFCDEEEMRKRVESPDRKNFGKITKWEESLRKMKKSNMNENVPFENNFQIDSTSLAAKETAKEILRIISR